jgi:hypothetical protein
MAFEYKVVPAPTKGQKAKGVKGVEERFAYALEALMNELASDGWEYLRADTLPSIERSGLTGSITEWRNLLVFRREAIQAEKAPVISEVREEPALSPMAPRPIPGPVATAETPDNLAHLPGVKKPEYSID